MKDSNGITTKQIVLEVRGDIKKILPIILKTKESLKWNWRITLIMLVAILSIISTSIIFAITQGGIK